MVQLGDSIKLKNPLFTSLYSEDKEWREEYMWRGHFQHVCLWFPKLKCRGENAKLFFDSSFSKIIEIELYEGTISVIQTDLFWIYYPKALEKGEIELLDQNSGPYPEYIEDKYTIEHLDFFEQKCKEGLFDILERENNKYDSYKRGFYLMRNEGKWRHLESNPKLK